MTEQRHDTPTRDPQLAAALRSLGEPPVDEVNWDALRARIRAGGELPLATRRRASREARRGAWTRRLIPVAAAASVALGVWIGADGGTDGAGQGVAVGEVEEVLRADLSEQEFRSLVSGRANADELLLVAVGGME